jgi:hypothetical protein
MFYPPDLAPRRILPYIRMSEASAILENVSWSRKHSSIILQILCCFRKSNLLKLISLNLRPFCPLPFKTLFRWMVPIRGFLIAWNPNKFKFISSVSKSFSISAQFESESNATLFWVTNVYGPNIDEERPTFFHEPRGLEEILQGPWLLAGDFNSVCFPQDRSSLHMSQNENLSNDTIWDLSLQEIPLSDRNFTWSNMQTPPILSKLDRVLINSAWDDILPNSVVSSP